MRATVKGNVRSLKALRSLMGQQISAESTTVAIQRWEIAKDVYRFTISEPFPPGEYALAEILPDGMNVFVWDFGVDSREPSSIRLKICSERFLSCFSVQPYFLNSRQNI